MEKRRLMMADALKPYQTIKDFVTGKNIPEIGAEANRQKVERMLIQKKGYSREDIEVDADIAFEAAGETYASMIDLVVSTDGGTNRCMVLKCVPGSLGSCEREIVAAARLLDPRYQIPVAVVSDGVNAIVIDANTGKNIGEGMEAIPDKMTAQNLMATATLKPCPENRIERERLIFRTYNCEYVNVAKNLPGSD
jgi:hypothetical protein